MKVRIGNDICLYVTLLGKNRNDYVNIKSIKAYLINTSRKNDIKELIEGEKRTVRFVSRFPEEPRCPEFRSTPYDLFQCGHPTFHVKPHCYKAYYTGFQVFPHTFEPFHNHLWAYGCPDKCPMPPHDEMDHMDIPDPNKYVAPVKAAESADKVYVYFPAEDQLHTGTYKLVIVAKLYEPGYAPDNLRTVTMDYKEVFTIVGSSEEADAYSSINIEVGNNTKASDISLSGMFSVGIGQSGQIEAVVLPADANRGVTWEVLGDGGNYINVVSSNNHTFIYSGKSLTPVNSPVLIKVTANSNEAVTKTIPVTVTEQGYIDKYTVSTQNVVETDAYNKPVRSYINLNIAGLDTPTTIDTTNENIWYEGD